MSAVYQRNYYTEHKEGILKQMAKPEFCKVCNKHVTHGYMSKHARSNRHLRLTKISNEELENNIEIKLKELLF